MHILSPKSVLFAILSFVSVFAGASEQSLTPEERLRAEIHKILKADFDRIGRALPDFYLETSAFNQKNGVKLTPGRYFLSEDTAITDFPDEGPMKPFTPEQLADMREHGRFYIRLGGDQKQTWEVHIMFGAKKRREARQALNAHVKALVVDYAWEAATSDKSDKLSIRKGMNNIGASVVKAADTVVGIGKTYPAYSPARIEEIVRSLRLETRYHANSIKDFETKWPEQEAKLRERLTSARIPAPMKMHALRRHPAIFGSQLQDGSYVPAQNLEVTVDTSQPLWRINHAIWQFISRYWNAMSFLWVDNLLLGPIGVPALCQAKYIDSYDVDPDTGELTSGLLANGCRTELARIWQEACDARTRFHSRPYNGVFNPDVANKVNFVGNYGSACGKIAARGGLQAVFTAINVAATLAATVFLPPVLVTEGVIENFIFNPLIYDTASPMDGDRVSPLGQILVGDFAFAGVGQAGIATLQTLFYPTLAAGEYIGGHLLIGAWTVSDFFLYQLIRSAGHQPAESDILVGQVDGPAQSRVHYYQIDAAIALVALKVQLEKYELQTAIAKWKDAKEDAKNLLEMRSRTHLKEILNGVCTPGQVNSASYRQTSDQIDHQAENMRLLADERARLLSSQMHLEADMRLMRLNREHLAMVIQKGKHLVHNFLLKLNTPTRKQIFAHYSTDNEEVLLKLLLQNAFNDSILKPLEDLEYDSLSQLSHPALAALASKF